MTTEKSNETLEYKGYVGSIEYYLEGKYFFGKVLFIDDLVLYEGTSIEELEKSFHEMVDDYLQTCKELKK